MPSQGPADARAPVAFIPSDTPERGPEDGVALCLSGGGYRAMLFHLGALWRINELALLPRLARISSVSTGSIVAGRLGLKWQAWRFGAAGGGAGFAGGGLHHGPRTGPAIRAVYDGPAADGWRGLRQSGVGDDLEEIPHRARQRRGRQSSAARKGQRELDQPVDSSGGARSCAGGEPAETAIDCIVPRQRAPRGLLGDWVGHLELCARRRAALPARPDCRAGEDPNALEAAGRHGSGAPDRLGLRNLRRGPTQALRSGVPQGDPVSVPARRLILSTAPGYAIPGESHSTACDFSPARMFR